MGEARYAHRLRKDFCMDTRAKLPDRNDSADERQARINDRHQALNGDQVRQGCKAHLDLLPRAGRDRRQIGLLAVIDQGVVNLRVIDEEIEQVQRPVRERGIDEHQIKRCTTVIDQGQQFRKTVYRRNPVVTELVEQALDSHPLEMLLVGNQDA